MLFHDDLRGFLQIADASVVAKSFPQLWILAEGALAADLIVGSSRIQRFQYGMTVFTCVCCSMISETQMA
jgi:hypothetical protein